MCFLSRRASRSSKLKSRGRFGWNVALSKAVLKTAASNGFSKIKPQKGADPVSAIVPDEGVKTGKNSSHPCSVQLVWDACYERLRVMAWKFRMEPGALKAVFENKGVVYK